MKISLNSGIENDENVFSLTFANRENIINNSPSRAFKKYGSNSNKLFTEVFLSIKNEEINGSKYDSFNNNIERKLKRSESNDNINIITFFGDKYVDSNKLSNFEDIQLLSNFESLFNDNLICMPYTQKFYFDSFDTIFDKTKEIYNTFSGVLTKTSLVGYLPAYLHYRDADKFLKFYSGKATGDVYNNGSTLNAIPLMIDFKRSNPDNFKRFVAYLLKLKQKYIKEGYYPIYYAFNVNRPRLSKKRDTEAAKEFLLSLLGFDIIGASNAIIAGYGTNYSNEVNFDISSFSYKFTGSKINTGDAYDNKNMMYNSQTAYLTNIHTNSLNDKDYVKKELGSRKMAMDYIKTMNA